MLCAALLSGTSRGCPLQPATDKATYSEGSCTFHFFQSRRVLAQAPWAKTRAMG